MIIDFVFIICLILAAWKGYRKGFVVAVFSLAGIVLGLAAAVKLSAVVAERLKSSTSISGPWLPFVSFLLVMIGVILLVRLVAGVIQAGMEMAFLGWANRIAGILLYGLLYTIVLSILVFYLAKLQLLDPQTIAASKTHPWLAPLGPKVLDGFGKLVPIFKDMFASLSEFFASKAG
jgi:membrane protein required for colicin V production